MQVRPPPEAGPAHRDPRILCRLGGQRYCPGEVLFSLGAAEPLGAVCRCAVYSFVLIYI